MPCNIRKYFPSSSTELSNRPGDFCSVKRRTIITTVIRHSGDDGNKCSSCIKDLLVSFLLPWEWSRNYYIQGKMLQKQDNVTIIYMLGK